jgi:hypothetical protein
MLKLNKKYDKHNSNGDYKMLKENDKGIVSIVVVIIFIIVIGLIVIGFGELSRNQTQQTIDNQLSSASYYAADSGINDILKYVIKNINNSTSLSSNSCTGFSNISEINTEINTFNSNNKSSSKITCATWTNNVTSLIYSNVGDSNNQIIYLNPNDLNNSDNYIDIQWTNLSNTNILNNCNPSNNDYLSSSSYNKNCNIGELRLDIAPPIGSGCNSISSCPSETIFAQATDGTNQTSNIFSTSSKPQILQAFVTGGNTENLVIDCKSSSPLCGYINIRSLYANSNISIKAYPSSDITRNSNNIYRNSGKY